MASIIESKQSDLPVFNDTKMETSKPMVKLQIAGINFGKRDNIISPEMTSQEKVHSIAISQNDAFGTTQQLTHLLCFFATVALSFLTVCGIFATIYFLLLDPTDDNSEEENDKSSRSDGSMDDIETSDDEHNLERNKFALMDNMTMPAVNNLGSHKHLGIKQNDKQITKLFKTDYTAVELPLLDGLQDGALYGKWNERCRKGYWEDILLL